MEKLFSIIQVVAPIVLAVFLGVIARKKQLLTPEENQGLQSFVIKFGLPCVIFKSCLTADMTEQETELLENLLQRMLAKASDWMDNH